MNPAEAKAILGRMRKLEIRTRRLVNDTLAGQYHSVFKGQGMDFEEVREYVPGDEVRTIDWNVTARSGRPFVKKFTEERELTLLLVVDVSASGDFGSASLTKRELAAEVGSLLAFSAIRNSDKVGLLLFTEQVELYLPPKKGRRHVLRLIREILYFQPLGRGTDLARAVKFGNDVLRRRSVVFVISDFESAEAPEIAAERLSQVLRQAGRRHDLIALQIQDEREKTLPDVGVMALEDAETGELVEIDTGDSAVRGRFAAAADEWSARLNRVLRTAGVDALTLNPTVPYLPPLLRFFKQRGRKLA